MADGEVNGTRLMMIGMGSLAPLKKLMRAKVGDMARIVKIADMD
jgi:hypothetical protein